MARQEERKARTRAAVLLAAREQFVSRGYAGTTIRDIATAAGVGVGTVHVHFGDKPTLLLACFQEQIASAVAQGLSSLPSEGSLLEQLLSLAGVLYAAYARHPALSRQMLQVVLLEPGGGDGSADSLAKLLSAVAALYQAAQARGELSHLPAEGAGMLPAQGFFAAYLSVLLGGLSGRLGPEDAPQAWLQALRPLLLLQLVGLGAPPELLFPVRK